MRNKATPATTAPKVMCDDAMIDFPLQEKWVIVHVGPQQAEPSWSC